MVMSTTVPIKVETLKAFADQARRLGSTTDELSTAEMLDTFGSAAVIKNQDITITANGVYTVGSGYTGFGTVVAEIELPNAEDASFGAESIAYEDGAVFGAVQGTLNQNGEYGYEFTANEDCMLYGFRHIGGYNNVYTLTLWEKTTGSAIAQFNNAKANQNWNQFLLDSPVKLVAGETYAVTQSGYPIYRTNSWTAASKRITKTRYCESYTNGTYPTYTTTVTRPVTMVDVLVGDLPSVSASEYRIQKATVDDISEQVQRIIGTTDKLTPAQMATALKGIASTA